MSEPGMVIVGSGKAAARAVVGLREHGWKGSVTLIGEEKHLPYDLPPLSKAAITAAEEPQPVLLLDESMLASLGVTRMSGVAVAAIDRAVEQQGRWIVFLLRLSPAFPFNLLNYALGLTRCGCATTPSARSSACCR